MTDLGSSLIPQRRYCCGAFVYYKLCQKEISYYRTQVRSLAMLVTNSLTHSLPFSKLDWCDPGVWRCLLKTCWGCYGAEISDEDRVGKTLLQIWMLRFGKKLNFCSNYEDFGQDFWVEVHAIFLSWSLVSILLLMFGWGYEVESRFWNCSRFVNCDLVIWTQPSGPLCLWQCFYKRHHGQVNVSLQPNLYSFAS